MIRQWVPEVRGTAGWGATIVTIILKQPTNKKFLLKTIAFVNSKAGLRISKTDVHTFFSSVAQ